MSRQIAYRRVSTTQHGQDTTRQLFETGINFDLEYEDKSSGKNTNRPAWQEMLLNVEEGDTIHVHSMDRSHRSVKNLLAFCDEMQERKVNVKFHKEGLEIGKSGSATSKLLFNIIACFADV